MCWQRISNVHFHFCIATYVAARVIPTLVGLIVVKVLPPSSRFPSLQAPQSKWYVFHPARTHPWIVIVESHLDERVSNAGSRWMAPFNLDDDRLTLNFTAPQEGQST